MHTKILIGAVLSICILAGITVLNIPFTKPYPVPVGTIDTVTEAYKFPVVPGTKEWQELDSHDAMVAVTQLPPQILDSISTKGLAMTVIHYPLLEDYLSYANPPKLGPQDRFELLATEFNGYATLSARPDAFSELSQMYVAYQLLSNEHIWESINTPDCNCDSINTVSNIEYLLAQQEILDTATPEERTRVLHKAQQVLREKQASTEYGLWGANPTAFLITRILRTAPTTCDAALQTDAAQYLYNKGEYIGADAEEFFNTLESCSLGNS